MLPRVRSEWAKTYQHCQANCPGGVHCVPVCVCVCVCVCVFSLYSLLAVQCVCVCPRGYVCGITKAKVIWHKHTHLHIRGRERERERERERSPALPGIVLAGLLASPPPSPLLLFASFLHPWSARLIPKLYPHLKTGTSRKPACLHCILTLAHMHTNPCARPRAHAACSCKHRERKRTAQRGVKHCGDNNTQQQQAKYPSGFFPGPEMSPAAGMWRAWRTR